MAMKILASRAASLIKRRQEIIQPFKYLLVVDFEATCEKDVLIKQPEIIEFPCLAFNTNTWQVEHIFHRYVKPKVNPILTTYCTDLTGITQDIVDDEKYFPQVFQDFQRWIEQYEFVNEENKSAFVTCGDWDFKVMLPDQCALDNVSIPNYMKQWINLKKSYCDATEYFPKSLKDMVVRLKIKPEGLLHSGFYDSINITKVIEALAKDHNASFNLTSKS